jgi:hypothetical protein
VSRPKFPADLYRRFTRRKMPYGDGRAPLSLSGWERIIEIRQRRAKGLL